jgi:hypothetical protein
MFEAARFDDEIAHTNALVGFLVGAALGLALVAAARFLSLRPAEPGPCCYPC